MKNMNEAEKLMVMVHEVNGWNGELESLNVWENDDDFFNTFFSGCGNLVSYNEYQVEELLKDFEEEIIESYNELVEDGSIEDYLNWF